MSKKASMENKNIMNETISDEELSQAVGGLKEGYTMGGYRYIGHVTQHNGVVGEWYYIVEDSGNRWAYGQMIITEKRSVSNAILAAFGKKERWHRFKVTQSSPGFGVSTIYAGVYEFEGEDWTLYKGRVKV